MNLFQKKLFRQRNNFICADYDKNLCPNAEIIQPRIKQFKTNYLDDAELEKQAEILRSTLEYFN